MPRNSGGTYTLPGSNPVTTGTTITSTWANETLQDIAAELTNSLARDGSGSMDTALLLPNGSAGAPALAFTSETNTGIYLEGATDLRLQVGATNAVKITSTDVTIPLGLVVTQDAPDGNAVTGTGNGTGYGGDFNGGSSNGTAVRGTGVGNGLGGYFIGGSTSGGGDGVYGYGGAADRIGVYGEGGANGPGVEGYGGAGNATGIFGGGTGSAAGVQGTGGPTGAGVRGIGGATSGAGGVFTGTAGNASGLTAAAHGTGAGVIGTGGSSSGIGGVFTGGATNGTGIQATGVGNGRGGLFGNAVGSTAAALEATSNSTAPAASFDNPSGGVSLQVGSGHVKFVGGSPISSTGFTNTLTPANVVKAWGYFTVNAGAITLQDGFNIASVAITSAVSVTVTLATAMANALFAVTATPQAGGSGIPIGAHVNSKTTTTLVLGAHKETGGSGQAAFQTATDSYGISFTVIGPQ